MHENVQTVYFRSHRALNTNLSQWHCLLHPLPVRCGQVSVMQKPNGLDHPAKVRQGRLARSGNLACAPGGVHGESVCADNPGKLPSHDIGVAEDECGAFPLLPDMDGLSLGLPLENQLLWGGHVQRVDAVEETKGNKVVRGTGLCVELAWHIMASV